MNESSWEECLEFHSSVKVSINPAKAASLIDTGKGRVIFLKSHIATSENANYLFEGYYSSVIELIHAVILLQGFKVNNHLCLGYYLRDVIQRDDFFRWFEDCRMKRNSLIYYGRKMEFVVAQESIKRALQLIDHLLKLLP